MRCNEWTTENTDYNYVLRKYIAMQKFLRIGKNISIVSSSSTRTWMILSVLQFAKLRKINNKLMISFLKNICKDLEMINNFWLIFKLRTSFIQLSSLFDLYVKNNLKCAIYINSTFRNKFFTLFCGLAKFT